VTRAWAAVPALLLTFASAVARAQGQPTQVPPLAPAGADEAVAGEGADEEGATPATPGDMQAQIDDLPRGPHRGRAWVVRKRIEAGLPE